MKTTGIKPRIEIKVPNLVKGIHFKRIRVLGKPNDFARHYYKNGVAYFFFGNFYSDKIFKKHQDLNLTQYN